MTSVSNTSAQSQSTTKTENVASLRSARKVQRGLVTRNTNRLEILLSDFDNNHDKVLAFNEIADLNELINERRAKLQAVDEDLRLAMHHEGEEESTIEKEMEESYDYTDELSMKSRRRQRRIDAIDPRRQAPNTGSSAGSTPRSNPSASTHRTVNLPKIELPTFSGNVLEWITFYDTYRSTIHDDKTLGDIQRFAYLKGVLRGEALLLISSLPLTEVNYAQALALLNERYGQKHMIISAHMEALWQLQSPTDDVTSLLRFNDTLESHIRGLQALGKDESTYGELLVPMILRKLPNNICTQIARILGNKAWNIVDLRKAITAEIHALQAGLTNVNNEGQTLGGQMSRLSITAFHAPTSGYRKQRHAVRQCLFCKGLHNPSDCTTITDPKKRLDIVKRDKLCYNCLANHLVSNCTSKFSCKHCERKHHSSLHFNDRPARQTSSNMCVSTPASDRNTTQAQSNEHSANGLTTTRANDTRVHLSTSQFRQPTGPVLLKTAVVPVTAKYGNIIYANVLFDEGATRSFATTRFAEKISMKPTTHRETVNLSTLGHQDKYSRTLFKGEIHMHTLTGDIVSIEPLVIPDISNNLTHHVTPDLLDLPYLRHLNLAHPVSIDQSFDIDILIGLDYFWEMVGDRVIRGSGPVAVNSIFGYILSGPKNNGQPNSNAQVLHVITDTQYEEKAIASYWDLETIGISADECKQNNVDKHIDYETYKTTHLRRDGGHYVAKLPWKQEHDELPVNYEVTLNRTRNMVRRLPSDILPVYDRLIREQE
ncbi:uncharacterized protein LOC100368473 [Saccoglossus kowalevskii]|uniref:Uncharacterized protein LOC100368473 n=1 Tax=Saccoglossus kowalevskii TaxID=10224 RepID=A0ABM0M9I5_SACKO|nr:PREDICTED: uncharacterized protein LOC100368473 [Saccoglossus kowalevskii]